MKTLEALKFLVIGPLILLMLIVINWMTGGPIWWHWAALGIGIAWVINLLVVIRAVLVLGGLAGLVALLSRR